MSKLSEYKKRLKTSADYCQPHWDRIISNYRHYFSKLTVVNNNSDNNEAVKKKYPFASKTSLGLSYDIVETALPRIIGRDPEFITTATETSDIPYEEVAKMTIESQYHNPKLAILGEPIYMKLQKIVKEALIAGTAVGRAYWRREGIKRAVYKGKIKETGKVGSLEEVSKFVAKYGDKYHIEYLKEYEKTPFLDDFDLRHLPVFFFYPDPYFSEPGRMRYMIERDYYTPQELISEAQIFGYDKAVLKEILENEGAQSFTPDIKKDFLVEYNNLFGDIHSSLDNDDDDKIHLLVVDKMWENGRVHVFVNEKYSLTGEEGIPSPYDLIRAPFVFTHNVLVPHSFFSRSDIDAIKKIEDAVNDLTNMRMDNLFQAMSSFYLVNPIVMEDGEDFLPLPNSVWKAKDVDRAIREFKGVDVTASVYKETEGLYNIIQKITGTTDYAKGGENITLAGRTYGGLRLAQEAANIRFMLKSTLFEQVTLRSLGYMMLEMARQFIDSKRIVRLVGEQSLKTRADVYQIDPLKLKSIKGFMDITVIPSSTRAVDEQAEVMKLNAFADRMASQKPPFDRLTSDLYDRFLLKYLPLLGFKDAYQWVRAMRSQNQPSSLEETPSSSEPQTNMPVGTSEVMTSQGVQQQPNPLQQILANQAGQVNKIPLQNLVG